MRIGTTKFFLSKKTKEFTKLNTISVAKNSKSKSPVNLKLVKRIGTCRKKNKMLAKNDEV